jgi:hypothetical protein
MERQGWPAMEQQRQLLATSSDQIWDYLSGQGMVEEDIAKYLTLASDAGTIAFTFGPDEASAPRYTICYAGGSYQLTVEHPA